MPVQLHLISDTISRWEVDALSNVSILAMSTSDRCSPLRRRDTGSVMVVGCDGDGGVGERVIIEIWSGGRNHMAGTIVRNTRKESQLVIAFVLGLGWIEIFVKFNEFYRRFLPLQIHID